uniref:EF-hand domain-containing protein n=3 Tax=Pycnococcus provasolii TaxID=41880 RepID=A0A7S3DZA0_9CHLO
MLMPTTEFAPVPLTSASGNGESTAPRSSSSASTSARLLPYAHPPATSSDVLEVLGVLLLVPRVVAAIATVLIAALMCSVAAVGLPTPPPAPLMPPPLGGWRRLVVKCAIGYGARILLFCLGFVRIRVKGEPLAPRTKAAAIVSNHQTFLDVCLWAYLAEAPVSVSAKENLGIPVMAGIMKAAQCVFVDRDDPNSAANATKQLTAVLTNDGFPKIVVYPEGNTSNGKQLTQFKLGAFLPLMPVQPAVITYHTFGKRVNASWVEPLGMPITVVALRLLCQPFHTMDVQLLPVVYPPTTAGSNVSTTDAAREFAALVRDKMASASNLPTTEHNYTDTSLMLRAARRGVHDPSVFCVEAGKVRTELGPRVGSHAGLVAAAKAFIDANGGEPLDADSLWSSLSSCEAGSGSGETTPLLDASDKSWGWWGGTRGLERVGLSSPEVALRAFDQTHDGKVTFREFLHGVASL